MEPEGGAMNTLIAIAILALSLFGPGWSSEHKAYWEWQLGHVLEGYQEHRLARGEWNPYGSELLLLGGGASLSLDDNAEYGTGFIPTESRFAICRRMPDGDLLCIVKRF